MKEAENFAHVDTHLSAGSQNCTLYHLLNAGFNMPSTRIGPHLPGFEKYFPCKNDSPQCRKLEQCTISSKVMYHMHPSPTIFQHKFVLAWSSKAAEQDLHQAQKRTQVFVGPPHSVKMLGLYMLTISYQPCPLIQVGVNLGLRKLHELHEASLHPQAFPRSLARGDRVPAGTLAQFWNSWNIWPEL